MLKADNKTLEQLSSLPNTVEVRDLGRTQVAADTLTVVGFYPMRGSIPQLKKLKLL